jgi:ATP-binding cassette subfamily C (CFTR/MRP) protein 4
VQPLLIAQILKYFSGEMELWEASVYGVAISISAFLVGYIYHPCMLNLFKLSMNVRVACTGLIYRKVWPPRNFNYINPNSYKVFEFGKALKLGMNSFESTSAGDVINIMSTDLTRMEYAILCAPYLFIGF